MILSKPLRNSVSIFKREFNSLTKLSLNNFSYNVKKLERGNNFYSSNKNLNDNEELLSNTNNLNIFINDGYSRLPVAFWLLGSAALVLFMITLGAYTRLTKSGLSMTKWKPIGYKYPENIEEWNFEFDSYKKTPEYEVNIDMTLKEFKKIFFVEYFHYLVRW